MLDHRGPIIARAPAGAVLLRAARHAQPLIRALTRAGIASVALPVTRIAAAPDPAAARALLAQAPPQLVIFTSPTAVGRAFALAPDLRVDRFTRVLAPGPGTARALRRRGISAQSPPTRHDSEGLLALLADNPLQDLPVWLIGAPGGRGRIEEGLSARGARVVPVHVYQRVPGRFDARHLAAVQALPPHSVLVASSVQAFEHLRGVASPQLLKRLRPMEVVVSSARVAEAARAAGFARAVIVGSAHTPALIERVKSLFLISP